MGAVAIPKTDRWHKKPTAMLGGVAIYLASMATILTLVTPHSAKTWTVVGASTFLFIVGLIDDALSIKPYQKLIGQIIGAGAIVYAGLVLPWTGSLAFNMAITFFWIVGITNAVNMLDNMDGLAAGVAAIAAAFLAVNFSMNGQVNEALMLVAFASALGGFLIYNHNPASIFMGDCGSMFIGFFLATAALLGEYGGRSRSLLAVLAVPVLTLLIPIFDTTFVTLLRKLAGRAASQGGRDHTSHRLVALGLSERRAVWMLYALAALSGFLALLVRNANLDISLAVLAVFSIGLTFLGVYLGEVRVYAEAELAQAKEKPVVSFLVDLSYRRRIFEVALDLLLIVLSYYAAYAVIFGPLSNSGDWQLFFKSLPVIVCVKLATFLVTGVYRGIWRYTSLSNVVDFAKASFLGSVVSVLVLVLAFRFEGYSRMVFALDGVFLLVLVTASRFAFRLLRGILPAAHLRNGRRVLVYGAGDGGELLFRELSNNADLHCVPVAFIDDDPNKAGKRIHGLPVHAGAESLERICAEYRVDEVLLSTAKISPTRLREVVERCERAGVPLKRMSIEIQPVTADASWVVDAPSEASPVTAEEPGLTPLLPSLPAPSSAKMLKIDH